VLTPGIRHVSYLRKLAAGPRSPGCARAPARSSAWSWRGSRS